MKFKVGDRVVILNLLDSLPHNWCNQQGVIIEITRQRRSKKKTIWPITVEFLDKNNTFVQTRFGEDEIKLSNSSVVRERLKIK